MSMLPAVKVTLDKKLNEDQCNAIAKKIAEMEGVLSVNFNNASKTGMVTYNGGNVRQKIVKIEGVVSVKHQM